MSLSNPQPNGKYKVQADLSPNIFDYFFGPDGVLFVPRGIRQTVICVFFSKLYDHCQRNNIPADWDSESAVTELIKRTNFDLTLPELLRRFPDGFTVDSAGGITPRPGRAAVGTAVRQRKQAAPDDVSGGTASVSGPVEDSRTDDGGGKTRGRGKKSRAKQDGAGASAS